jgi:D-alanine-D-alanine ligase
MRIGIFFGGSSREREISFAGGRTVYDNLDKALFEPIPIFIDSLNNMILLDWQFIYKGTIRDFYPTADFIPTSENGFQVYVESIFGKDFPSFKNLESLEMDKMISQIGKKISLEDLPKLIDFGFLCLHGNNGEDGSVQGILQWLKIPYSGSGILPSAIGMDKAAQKKLMVAGGFHSPKFEVIRKEDWITNSNRKNVFEKIKSELKLPIAIKPANQGSSIGATILKEADETKFVEAIDKAFFIKTLKATDWKNKTTIEKVALVKELTDIREGVGLPLKISKEILHFIQHDRQTQPVILSEAKELIINNPEELLNYFEKHFFESSEDIVLEGLDSEKEVLVEAFIKGREFSCIVAQDENGTPIALPPTEIIKGQELFDYRSKYLPGLSRKVTPISATDEQIQAIRNECEKLFRFFNFNVYARIDGFLSDDGKIFLNDPNTTSGMLPSSFFFHQAAEIGLNPSQFLSYIICTSLQQRIGLGFEAEKFSKQLIDLNLSIKNQKSKITNKIRVAVIMGGYSSERHISVESGRNIFEKLSSSKKYEPIPVFLFGNKDEHNLYMLPINMMLKDNADDIKEKVLHYAVHPMLDKIKLECEEITKKFAGENIQFAPNKISYTDLKGLCDVVFIALHGRPGEDGAVQNELNKIGLPYNGSGVESSQLTINKFDTLQLLKQNHLSVTDQFLLQKNDWQKSENDCMKIIHEKFSFPLIAKPVDDGCSSAVKKIKNDTELKAFVEQLFRTTEELLPAQAEILHLKPKEEFPNKDVVLIEALVDKKDCQKFMEVTVGLLTHRTENGTIMYEVFEPSEALADGDVLSLEEKFLAGQGQNITPARFSKDAKAFKIISKQVRKTIEDAAQLLKIEGYARIDAFVRIYDDLKADTLVIEANSLPGMTPATCIYHQAAIAGYKPYDFIDKILEYAMKK